MDIAIIPAYNPDRKLLELARELQEKRIEQIIVVNDGSVKSTEQIFNQLGDSVIILNHKVNKGKGAAIKTALTYISNIKCNIEGIVILDADGQHRPSDAIRLLDVVHKKDSSFVLGVRCFQGGIPFRSLLGNTVTKYVFRLFSGKWVSDTQTGLRAFSKDMVSYLINIRGDRYEYEMNVLLTCTKNNTLITEVPIDTIYHDQTNSCSHFRAVRDSLRIYGTILAFSGASLLSFLLDYLLFSILIRVIGLRFTEEIALIGANIGARLLSAGFNYYLNSTFVFRYKEKRARSLLSYIVLACFILILNTVILYCLHDYLGINKALAKLVTEMMLFAINFMVQKSFIFNKRRKQEDIIL